MSALLRGVFVPGLRAIMGAGVGSGPSPVKVGHNRGDVALLQGSKPSSCSCAWLWEPWEWFILQLLVTRLDTVTQQCPAPLDLTSASNAEELILHKPKGQCYQVVPESRVRPQCDHRGMTAPDLVLSLNHTMPQSMWGNRAEPEWS